MSALHATILEHFRVAFGPPGSIEGDDCHWALRPFAYVAAINLLLCQEGGDSIPVVWIFDPHDPSNGVTNIRVADESEIGPLIEQIVDRVKQAGRPKPH